MKKNYITPAMIIAKADTTSILVISGTNEEKGSGEQLTKGQSSSMWDYMNE